jgi:hypothetical protein
MVLTADILIKQENATKFKQLRENNSLVLSCNLRNGNRIVQIDVLDGM